MHQSTYQNCVAKANETSNSSADSSFTIVPAETSNGAPKGNEDVELKRTKKVTTDGGRERSDETTKKSLSLRSEF